MNILKIQCLSKILIFILVLVIINITGCKKPNIIEPAQKISDSDLISLLQTNSITPGCYHISDTKYEYKSASWVDNAIFDAYKTIWAEPWGKDINDCDDIALATLVFVRKLHRLSGGKSPLAIGRFSYLKKDWTGHVVIIGIVDNKKLLFWESQTGKRIVLDEEDIGRCLFYEW